jgi:hypothetical protein
LASSKAQRWPTFYFFYGSAELRLSSHGKLLIPGLLPLLWIVWNLDQHSSRGTFRQARTVGWSDEGRQNRRLLPWVMSRVEYEARPQCTVQRDWLRLALKTLGERLASLRDNGIVVFSFDGSVFSVRCDKKVIAFAGEGLPWTVCFKD